LAYVDQPLPEAETIDALLKALHSLPGEFLDGSG
jgi:hypothetical protein